MTTQSELHFIKAAAGSVGGRSRSRAKVEATRANMAKAREVLRAKREAKKSLAADGEGVDCQHDAPAL